MSGGILFLAHRLPFPPDRGDKIRSHHILRHLARLAPVHVGCLADDGQDMAHEHHLAEMAASHCLVRRTLPLPLAGLKALAGGEAVSLAAFRHPRLARYVQDTIARHDIRAIYVFSGQMGQYVPVDWRGRLIVDLGDVDSAKFEAYAVDGRWPRSWIDAREGRLMRAEEQRLARRADHTLFVSDAEAALFLSRLDPGVGASVRPLSNGIDCAFFDPAKSAVHPDLAGEPGPQVVFTGQMDYRRQLFHAREEAVRSLIPSPLRRGVFGPLGRVYPKADWAPRPLRAKATLLSLAASGEEGYARALAINAPELRDALYTPEFLRLRGDYRAEQPLTAMMRKAPARSGLDRAQYADLKFWLPGDILTKTDRASMAVSLEAREPLLDHRLVEFAASLPQRMRIRGVQGKWLLKKTMERYLPGDILYRAKQGFVTPVSQWLRGPLAAEARSIAASAALGRTGWFDNRRLSLLAEQHIAGQFDHGRLLWQLLVLDRALARLGTI